MTGINVVMVLTVLLVGALEAVMPWIEPPTECFAVSVPPAAKDDPRIRGLRRSYALAVVAMTCASVAVWLVASRGMSGIQTEAPSFVALVLAIVLVPLAFSFGLMLHHRSRVRDLKQAEGWEASGNRSAALVGEAGVPTPISLAWNLLYVLLALAMAVFAIVNYDRFIDVIPVHAGLDGTPDKYAEKSLGVMLYPAVLTAFMGLVFTFAHWMTLRSRRPVDPAAPATSALAYGQFARVQSLVMLVGGLILCTVMGGVFFLPALGIVSLGTAGIAMSAATLVFVLVVIVISVRMGQSGANLAAELRSTDELARDDDAHWPLGLFYFNADDPSIVVPKRFGVGWTVNFARPAAWLAFLAILLLCGVLTWASALLLG